MAEVVKPVWAVGEAVIWICTRDVELLEHVSGMTVESRFSLGLVGALRPIDPRRLLLYQQVYPDAQKKAAPPTPPIIPADICGLLMWPDEALEELLRKTISGSISITAIKCGTHDNKRVPVPRTEVNGLGFWFQADTGTPLAGLYSWSLNALVWHSPEFLSAKVMRAWPARNKKTINVTKLILAHLHQIMSTDSPLTKLKARDLCLAEVPNAYPAAFEKAWLDLDRGLKRGCGKHGPRAH